MNQSVAVFDKLAQHYADKYGDVSQYADGLRQFCALLPPDAKMLELACGPGNVTRFILDLRADLNVTATDLSPNMLEIAKRRNPEAQFAIMDCRDLITVDKTDAILCAFGLPYLSTNEAKQLISDAASKLSNGGALYLSTMEGEPSQTGWYTGSTGDRMFLNYHQEKPLVEAIENSGLTVVRNEKIDALMNGSPVVERILIAQQ